MLGRLMSNELERISKEEIRAYFMCVDIGSEGLTKIAKTSVT
jgi:hypothetical protein